MAELQALAGARADLLAEVVGILEGSSEGGFEAPLCRQTAGLCRKATAAREAVLASRSTAGIELRQARAAVWEARLAGLRPRRPAARRPRSGAKKKELAASYQAVDEAYRQREATFAALMADRTDWEAATRQQRHLAVAVGADLRAARCAPGAASPA